MTNAVAINQPAVLLPVLSGLEWTIRHEPNRPPTLENAEFLPSLDGQIT
jgi:hypothetical protein